MTRHYSATDTEHDEARAQTQLVGFCETCANNVVRFRERWHCGCTGLGGVTRWRRGWTAWNA